MALSQNLVPSLTWINHAHHCVAIYDTIRMLPAGLRAYHVPTPLLINMHYGQAIVLAEQLEGPIAACQLEAQHT